MINKYKYKDKVTITKEPKTTGVIERYEDYYMVYVVRTKDGTRCVKEKFLEPWIEEEMK